jgi:hypothetical protein
MAQFGAINSHIVYPKNNENANNQPKCVNANIWSYKLHFLDSQEQVNSTLTS